jgi:hypothetical protein
MYRFPAKIDELNFPVPDQPLPPAPSRTMDEYAAWVDEEQQWNGSPEDRRNLHDRTPVNVPFRLFD